MRNSERTASQNQAMSCVERRINSANDSLPWRLMNRVRLLRAMSSGAGRQAIGWVTWNVSTVRHSIGFARGLHSSFHPLGQQLAAAGDTEVPVQCLHVMMDGVVAEAQLGGDLLF